MGQQAFLGWFLDPLWDLARFAQRWPFPDSFLDPPPSPPSSLPLLLPLLSALLSLQHYASSWKKKGSYDTRLCELSTECVCERRIESKGREGRSRAGELRSEAKLSPESGNESGNQSVRAHLGAVRPASQVRSWI